jgi:hypothetical protein
MADPEPVPETPPIPKAEPAPATPDPAGELKELRAELAALRKVVAEMPEEFAKIIQQQKAPPPPTPRKPLPGFKPGVFKGR